MSPSPPSPPAGPAGPESRAAPAGGAAFLVRALRHRNYRLFFSGQSVSLVGSWMTRIATSWPCPS